MKTRIHLMFGKHGFLNIGINKNTFGIGLYFHHPPLLMITIEILWFELYIGWKFKK